MLRLYKNANALKNPHLNKSSDKRTFSVLGI